MQKLIDLTHTLSETIPAWDMACGFKMSLAMDYQHQDNEVKFRVHQLNCPAGIGTHIDAPAHCIPGGMTIADISLNQLIAPCIVINVAKNMHEHYRLSVADIQQFEAIHGQIPRQSLVIIYTGWSQYWDKPERYHNHLIFPSVSAEAAEFLLQRDIVGLGIDTLSPDCADSGYLVHHLILKAGKYIIENIANADSLPATGATVIALPLKISQATESPIRLIALL